VEAMLRNLQLSPKQYEQATYRFREIPPEERKAIHQLLKQISESEMDERLFYIGAYELLKGDFQGLCDDTAIKDNVSVLDTFIAERILLMSSLQ
jgi:hypothetical protein